MFLRYLLPRLTGRAGTDVVDLSTVELTHIKHARSGERDLDLGGGELKLLKPAERDRHGHRQGSAPRPPRGGACQDQRSVRRRGLHPC